MIRCVCCRYRKFRGNSRSVDDSEYNFRRHDFHNNQKNSRGKDGIHCQRKTWTKRALNLEHTCPFYFYNIAYDTKAFFVVPGLGVKKYFYHNQHLNTKITDMFESRRQLSVQNEKRVADMGRGKLSATQIQKANFQSSGNLLSLYL